MKQLIILCQFLLVGSGWAQQDTSVMIADKITPEEIRKHLEILASDEFEGRETAMEGQRKAAAYIEAHFKNLGLEPMPNGAYQQPFDVVVNKADGVLEMNGKEYAFLSEFYFYKAQKDTVMRPQIVYAGRGRKADFEMANVKGKAVLVSDADFGKFKASGYDWKLRAKQAKQMGASCVLVITPNFHDKKKILEYYLSFSTMRLPGDEDPDPESRATPDIPYLFISEELGINILKHAGKNPSKLHKLKVGEVLGEPLQIRLSGADKVMESTNVMGVLPGTDLKDEYLIITAHYDHLGKKGELIFRGADDDGSGTSTLLTLASAFSKAKSEGVQFRRSIIFMAVSGEEKGLLGSEYYVNNPVYPLEHTIADLNIDMIGRIDDEHKPDTNYVYLIGSDRMSTELHQISENANSSYTKLDLDYTYNDPADPNQFYYRSDHYNFASNGIPVIFYFTGVHEDYHQATDTFDKIMYGKTAQIARLVSHTAYALVMRSSRPLVDVKQ